MFSVRLPPLTTTSACRLSPHAPAVLASTLSVLPLAPASISEDFRGVGPSWRETTSDSPPSAKNTCAHTLARLHETGAPNRVMNCAKDLTSVGRLGPFSVKSTMYQRPVRLRRARAAAVTALRMVLPGRATGYSLGRARRTRWP